MSNAFESVVMCLLLGLCSRFAVGIYTIYRSSQFLEQARERRSESSGENRSTNIEEYRPRMVLVIPVMMEQEVIADAVLHFARLAECVECEVLFVTSERDSLLCLPGQCTTFTAIQQRGLRYPVRHIHFLDASGTKADQLNYAREILSADRVDAETYLIFYDVDSRPTAESLRRFLECIMAHPHHNVFQQCSRFSYRGSRPGRGTLSIALRHCASLRINRFVRLYELPRIKRRLTRAHLPCFTYAHVVGHGLAIRNSYLAAFPFPSRSIMEDMFYGFLLNSRKEAVVPVPSLDDADVPVSLREDIRQASRWFAGPARGALYFMHPQCERSFETVGVLIHSALDSCAWLVQAVAIPLIVTVVLVGSQPVASLTLLFVAIYSATVLATLVTFRDAAVPASEWLLALLLYPFWITIFGLAGWWGLWRLMVAPRELNYKTLHY